MAMTKAAAQSVEFADEECDISSDMGESREWLGLENRIFDLLNRFPQG
jgi:hypothetical protein